MASGILRITRSWKCLLIKYHYGFFQITIVILSLNIQLTISRCTGLITIIMTVNVPMIVVDFTGHTTGITCCASSECGSCDWDHVNEWEPQAWIHLITWRTDDKKVTWLNKFYLVHQLNIANNVADSYFNLGCWFHNVSFTVWKYVWPRTSAA